MKMRAGISIPALFYRRRQVLDPLDDDLVCKYCGHQQSVDLNAETREMYHLTLRLMNEIRRLESKNSALNKRLDEVSIELVKEKEIRAHDRDQYYLSLRELHDYYKIDKPV
jgi:hypothetical protein